MSDASELGLMRGVLDSLEQPVIAADAHGAIWFANTAAVRTVRRPTAELIGANVADVVQIPRRSYGPLVDARERFLEIVSAIGPAGGATERELTLNDTSPVDVRATITELTGEEPGWVLTLGSLRTDIGSFADDQGLRPVTGRVDLIELNDVVKDAVGQCDGAAPDGAITLRYDVPPGVHPIEADRKRLFQVLINLIGNAITYSDGGTVLVQVVTEETGGRPERIDVVDEGPGIPAASLDAVFEAFWQGRSTTGNGSGLGLTIARSMCRAMGFELSVDSIEGDGSTFSILLTDEASQPDHVPVRELGRGW